MDFKDDIVAISSPSGMGAISLIRVSGEKALENAGLTCNKNGIPFDPLPPSITSGIRFGTAAATTRGFEEKEFELIDGIENFLDTTKKRGFKNIIVTNQPDYKRGILKKKDIYAFVD